MTPERSEQVPGEPGPDAVAKGWVVPPGGTRVEAIFVLSGTSLGIGRVERASSPVWLDLRDLVNLDAIGDPVDGLTEVEMRMYDEREIGAGWTDEFCAAVVDALQATTTPARQVQDHTPPAPPSPPIETVATSAPTAPVPSAPPVVPAVAEAEPGPTSAAVAADEPSVEPAAPSADAASPLTEPAAAPVTTPSGALELEDVVYLGGYPGQSKRRKKCVVAMARNALELKGPGDLHFRIGWDVVRTIEVQNADEARFRMNTKIHRDASALVLECDQGVTILLEARDCPTVALRSAINQLLDGLPVVVV